jgi:hypothetical protein
LCFIVISKYLKASDFIFFSQNHESILSLVVKAGAEIFQEGWIQIGDDSLFGSSLVLALWIQKKFGTSDISGKIFQIIYSQFQKQCSSMSPRGNCFKNNIFLDVQCGI